MHASSRKKRVLITESGSFKTFGGAVKDSHRLYIYLKSLGRYRVDLVMDFDIESDFSALMGNIFANLDIALLPARVE